MCAISEAQPTYINYINVNYVIFICLKEDTHKMVFCKNLSTPMFTQSFKIEDTMRINVCVLRTDFVCAGREFRGDLVDGWTVDREGCHGDHVGSQLNKCWQELEQPLRPQAPASISSCSLGIRQRICLSFSLSFSWHERVSIVARVVWHAKFELDSPREFSFSYTYVQKL